ncbi:MAG: Rv3235 family protein [Pseudonocardiaceae bacterium]
MTTSIAEPRPHLSHRPVLRRLVDLLPPPPPAAPQPVPATPQPPTVTLPAANPAASVLAERVLRAVVEILGGRRPARQLSAVLSPDLLTYLATLKSVAGHLQPRVRKVFARPQADGALEAVALVTLNTGVRALAARFEEHVDDGGRRWRCTALQLRLTAGDVAIRRDSRTRRR